MAMEPERSKPLHNFALPCLKWANQRSLRCVKVPPSEHPPPLNPRRSSHLNNHNRYQTDTLPNSKRKAIAEDDIDAVREKLMIDLKVAANKLKVSIFEEEGVAADANTRSKPWNLRTRRAACKAPQQREEKKNLESVPEAVAAAKENNPTSLEEKIGERTKFSVSVSKEEVEQDFWALVGTRPPRRPKKRPRNVQRQLDTLYPGLWLTEVTAESYKVPDVPE